MGGKTNMEIKVIKCDACTHVARCYSAILSGHDVWLCIDFHTCLRAARNLRVGYWA